MTIKAIITLKRPSLDIEFPGPASSIAAEYLEAINLAHSTPGFISEERVYSEDELTSTITELWENFGAFKTSRTHSVMDTIHDYRTSVGISRDLEIYKIMEDDSEVVFAENHS